MIVGPWQYATGGMAVALALSLAWGVRVDSLREGHKLAHEQTKHDYKAAQARAQAAFDAQITATQAHNRRLNDEADKKVADTTIVYRDRVVRLRSAPAQCIAGGAQMPGPDVPERADGPGADPVVLERADALICAVNTARLEAAREWALGMAK